MKPDPVWVIKTKIQKKQFKKYLNLRPNRIVKKESKKHDYKVQLKKDELVLIAFNSDKSTSLCRHLYLGLTKIFVKRVFIVEIAKNITTITTITFANQRSRIDC